MIIGLTGGIATGKSTVSSILKKLGARIVDSDKIAHRILRKGGPAWRDVINHFGLEILTERGEIDRTLLGKIIFADPEARKMLEEITHPLIIGEIEEQIEKINLEGGMAVLDAPLLFETGLDRLVDQVWLVYVDRETQLNRLLRRDSLSPEEAEQRISAQLDLECKREMADVVIDNRGSLDELRITVSKLWERVC